MSAPKRLLIEYEDGSSKGVDFAVLDKPMRIELARLGLCPVPAGIAPSRYYVVMRWKDGWQQVVAVDSATVELIRYYVIRRIEDRGRLSFEVGAEWPELFVIKRKAGDLANILVVGKDGAKNYAFDGSLDRWEGTFEAGGKKEYVKFDKTDPRAPQQSGEAPEALAAMIDSVKSQLGRMDILPQALPAMEEVRRIEAYKEVAKGLGLMGHERQEDVYGFVEFLVGQAIRSA